jgi:ankyrin repeat protein
MDPRFHPAEAAIAGGDLERLAALLTADPDLATARSTCSHPTLLQCLVLTMPPADSLDAMIDLLAHHGAELTDPLIAACSIGNVRAATKLLDLGAAIDGNGRWSPLEEALYWGNEGCVDLLLARGAASPNLRTAAGLGRVDEIRRCFDASGALTPAAGEIASPWFRKLAPEEIRRDPLQILTNALVYAAAWGHDEAVDLLLDRGAQVNFIPAGFDFSGTALHYAALNGRRVMIDHLLRRGADPSVRDTKIGKLPEDWADHAKHHALAEYLRKQRTG